jgi:predicted transposase YbfD/YdcC
MIDSEEEKQNYLRENILDKGYEAEEFVSYLTSKKGEEGVNLNNWSLEELKSVVQEYIKNNPINNKIENDNNIQNIPNQMNMNINMQNNLLQNPLLQNMNIPQGMNYPNILQIMMIILIICNWLRKIWKK